MVAEYDPQRGAANKHIPPTVQCIGSLKSPDVSSLSPTDILRFCIKIPLKPRCL